jgi:4-hydroxybenzoate polyprenyltransferase
VVTLPNGDTFLMEPAFHQLWWWVLAYAAFAFLSTLVRELQKDMADVKGDAAAGCRTVPIVWGMRTARLLVLAYIAALILALLVVRSAFLHGPLAFWWIGIGIILPLLLAAGFTWQANERGSHMRAGLLTKLAMAAAVCFAFLIRLLP